MYVCVYIYIYIYMYIYIYIYVLQILQIGAAADGIGTPRHNSINITC